NNILTNKSTFTTVVQEALEKGVYFDVGDGTSNFSFLITEEAKKKGIPFHSISTDIYELNQLEGPVYNLAETMTKFLAIGHSLEKVIQAVTETPAQMIGKSNLGRLEKGKAADLTFFTIDDKNVELQDSFGHVKQTNKIITPHAVMINASGKMSILGVSVMSDPVILAMKEGAAHFYIMEELHEQAGAQIAAYLQTESVMVTNSASSGIALSVAGLITKDNQVSYRNV